MLKKPETGGRGTQSSFFGGGGGGCSDPHSPNPTPSVVEVRVGHSPTAIPPSPQHNARPEGGIHVPHHRRSPTVLSPAPSSGAHTLRT